MLSCFNVCADSTHTSETPHPDDHLQKVLLIVEGVCTAWAESALEKHLR